MLGKLLIFCALAAIVGEGVDADAATRGEDARHLDIFGVHEADEVLHDDVDAVFVEIAVVAETEEVELKTLALYHAHVGDILYANLGKVGLTRDGAQRCKLGAVELHPIVVVGVFVYERLKHLGCIIVFIARLGAQGLQPFVFSCIHCL